MHDVPRSVITNERPEATYRQGGETTSLASPGWSDAQLICGVVVYA